MSPDRIYRFSIWLPLIVPLAVIVIMNVLITGFGLPKPSGLFDVALETIALSALYGGLPYIPLALWATWWIRGRAEPEVRRVMLFAPCLMVVVFAVACLIVGTVADRMEIWTRIAVRGAGVIIPLGYGYVALTLSLRRWLGPRTREAGP